MLIRSRHGRKRSGTAAVEAALVLPVMMYAILGAIEFTRMIEVQQILVNAVREGGRAAATGQILAGPYLTGPGGTSATDPNGYALNLAQIPPYSGLIPGCEVELLVLYYIQNAGLYHTAGQSIVTVTNSGTPTAPHSPAWSCTVTITAVTATGQLSTYSSTSTGAVSPTTGSPYDPAAAASQLDNLSVNAEFQFKNNSWLPLYWFYASGVTMSAKSDWLSARDQPVQGAYAIPTLP
jgi:hypothetical protein